MDILSLLRNSPGAQAWLAQQAPSTGLSALGLSQREMLDREMSYDGSHPRQQEQAARDHFRSYGPNMLMDALIPGYGAGGDAKAASEAYGEGRYGAAAGNALMAAMDFVPMLAALPAAVKGIRAYHGSPHDFDRFDMSKVGTGEGGRAMGWGANMAEAEETAKYYRDNLSPKGRGFLYELEVNAGDDDFIDWDSPLGEQSDKVKKAASALGLTDAPQVSVAWGEAGGNIGAPLNNGRAIYGRAKPVARGFEVSYGSRNLGVYPDRDSAEAALYRAYEEKGSPIPNRETAEAGRNLYLGLAGGRDGMKDASEAFRDAGIAGIKYRGSGGKREYVVFDDRLITILRKYGIGGLIAGGGAYALTDAEYAQAAELLAQDGMNTGAQ